MKITRSVFMLSGSAYSAVNNSDMMGEVYGIYTSQGIVLIDCGKERSGLDTLRETLTHFNVDVPITHCILTPAHHDHCGNAKQLQMEGAVIIVGKEDESYCIRGGVWGLNSPFENEQGYRPFTPDVLIERDQIVEINGLPFEFIKVPGHTPGSMAVRIEIDEKTILFTGDMLQLDGIFLNSVNFGWMGDPLFNRDELVKSMIKLMKYTADIILPGHGRICLRNGTNLLLHAAKKAYTSMR